MNELPPQPYARALHWAEQIKARLAPMCDRIEIAGSIRRQRELCGDIDLIVLPKPGCGAELRERIRAGGTAIKDGAQNMIVRLANGFQLDVFIARPAERDLVGDSTPCNFGTLLLCRTGSKQHNIKLACAANRRGLHWDPYNGLLDQDGSLISAEEDGILRELLGAVPAPEARD